MTPERDAGKTEDPLEAREREILAALRATMAGPAPEPAAGGAASGSPEQNLLAALEALDEPEDPVEAREQELLSALADAEPETPLTLRVTDRRGIPVIELQGEVDVYTCPAFEQRVEALLEENPPGLVVDLTRTEYIDSRGMGVILKACRSMPHSLAVVSPKDRITRLFRAVGLAERVGLHATVREALDALEAA